MRALNEHELRATIRSMPVSELTSLGEIASLPGFARTAAASLRAAWNAGVDLKARALESSSEAARQRFLELARLEAHVRSSLEPGVLIPPDLVLNALERVGFAPRLLGAVTLESIGEIPPLYRELLRVLSELVELSWVGAAFEEGGNGQLEWAPRVRLQPRASSAPRLLFVSCADPPHEALEALRWARALLTRGVKAEEIAIATTNVSVYDDQVHSLIRASGLPLHSAHGVPALSTPAGQHAAAFADALLAGPTQPRIRRLLACAAASGCKKLGEFSDSLPESVKPGALLDTPARWSSALSSLRETSPSLAQLLLSLVNDLSAGADNGGVDRAVAAGERWLTGGALDLWRSALVGAPPAALPAVIASLRLHDGSDPATRILWGPAEYLVAWPRPYTRLLGLTSRSWPRRGTDDDPLIPVRFTGAPLKERSVARRDAAHFRALIAGATKKVVLSRARRGADGRRQTPSPLLAELEGHEAFTELSAHPLSGEVHALSEADRRSLSRAELSADARLRRCQASYLRAFTPGFTPHDGKVRGDHPLILKALARPHSATSLRSLLTNPHGFVARYALGWEEPEVELPARRLNARDHGSFVHAVLELALTELEEQGGIKEASGEQLRASCLRAAQAVAKAWAEEVSVPPRLAWEQQISSAAALAARMLALSGQPLPQQRSHAELRFGFSEDDSARNGRLPFPAHAEVRVPEAGVRLRGVIDRLDICDESRTVRVIDYKSGALGRRSLHKGYLDGGGELQRAVYSLAVRQLMGGGYALQTGLLYADRRAPLFLEDPDGAVRALEQAILEGVRLLREGWAVPGPGLDNPFEETLIAHPAAGANNYLNVKGDALAGVRGALDELLAAAPGQGGTAAGIEA